jgi:NAD(P)-dependent dehydrogenase (short-subunit alcohol dehydrogenase family)
MSAALKEKANWAASFPGTIAKQVFHRVPRLPSNVNLRGETAIVTGASSGLGLECTRQLLQLDVALLIVAVRSQSKGDEAARQLQAAFPKAKIQVWLLDMESTESVRQFAARCETLDRLDVVILNAGCGKLSYERAGGNGREVSLQVNYLNTVLLTMLLVPVLRVKQLVVSQKANMSVKPGRLTVVSSDMASWAKLKEAKGSLLDSVDIEEGFDGFQQYGMTKLLLCMFIAKLANVVEADDAIINIVNPSATRGTALMREAKGQYMTQMFVFLSNALMGRNVVDSTRQYLFSALVLGKESHGSFGDWMIRP